MGDKKRTYRAFFMLYLIGTFGVYAGIRVLGVSLSTLVFPIFYLISVFIYNKIKWHKGKSDVLNLSILLLTGLIISSMFSYNALKSLGYVLMLYFNIIFSFILFVYFSREHLFRFILLALKILLTLSIFYFFIDSKFVIYFDPLDRDSLLGLPNFKGFYPHKIHAGFYNTIGVLLSFYFFKKYRDKYDLIWSGIFFISVLATGSSLGFTSLVCVFFLVKLLVFLRIRLGYHLTFACLLLLFLGGVIIYMYDIQYLFLELLGRDKTLTGRTEIWDFGLDYIFANYWLGGGFSIFFDQVPQAPANALWYQTLYYEAPSFHNGFIEILAEGGVVGGIPFLLMILWVFFSCLKRADFVFLGIAILCIIANFGAAVFVKPNMFFWVMLCYIVFYNNLSTKLKRQIIK